MDFTYIFDKTSPDNRAFMRGELVSREAVDTELGLPESVHPISITTDDAEILAHGRPAFAAEEIERAVASTGEWRLTDEEMDELLR